MYSPQPREANNKKMGYRDQYKISSSDRNCQLRFGPIHDFIDVRVAILIETTRPVIDQRKNQPTETRNIFAYLVFVNILRNLKISEKKENSIHAGTLWLRLQKKVVKNIWGSKIHPTKATHFGLIFKWLYIFWLYCQLENKLKNCRCLTLRLGSSTVRMESVRK